MILVAPHYPENVGAAARAIKTMGISELWLVRPGRLALPENEMAFKMAVRAWDVLEAARVVDSLEEAVRGCALVFATTARRGQNALLTPRQAAELAQTAALRQQANAVVIGNEKTGLSSQDLSLCNQRVRIPMAADQPSINLAQTVQIMAYEWFMQGIQQHTEQAMARAASEAAPEDEFEGPP